MSIFTGLEEDFEEFWANHVKPFIIDDVEPILKAFVKQFDTTFGAQAIAAAMEAVSELESGGSFSSVSSTLATELFDNAKADAEDGAVLTATQVLQTVQSALQVAKSANNVTTAADKVIISAVEAPQ